MFKRDYNHSAPAQNVSGHNMNFINKNKLLTVKLLNPFILYALFTILCFFCLLSPVFSADANNMKINYQGFLRENGLPVTGTKGFKFSIKDGVSLLYLHAPYRS